MQRAYSEPLRFSFAHVYRAWQSCQRGKRGTKAAQRYEVRLLDHLMATVQALQNDSWRPSRATRFVTLRPKPREILAADFADRVVHHIIVPWFERLYEPIFIHDSCANRRGRGAHFAVDRLQHFQRSVTANGAKPAYFLQLDIANFFHSIDRRTLFNILRRRVERDAKRFGADARHVDADDGLAMLRLVRRLLTGNPGRNASFRGDPNLLAKVPSHKQLLNAEPGKGLPIGNLTSQFFANVYLNELDQFVKHELRCPHYVRYVDDFVLLSNCAAQLETWRAAVVNFLGERLSLQLRAPLPKPTLISSGVDFLGYVVRPRYRLIRRRVVGQMRARIASLRPTTTRSTGGRSRYALGRLQPDDISRLRASLTSYLGHCQHGQSAQLVRSLWRRERWLAKVFCYQRIRRIGGGVKFALYPAQQGALDFDFA